jgi:hypothetical protein
MLILTEDASLVCLHEMGNVKMEPTQDLVRVEERFVLVAPNPEFRPISGCPNFAIAIRPCRNTLVVRRGYSELVSIEGNRLCLDSIRGLTDGTPPGIVEYKVQDAGQNFVAEQE